MTATVLPDPECSFGYPLAQLRKLLGDERLGLFWVSMIGRTVRHCFGTRQSPPHGPVVYPADLHQWMQEEAA